MTDVGVSRLITCLIGCKRHWKPLSGVILSAKSVAYMLIRLKTEDWRKNKFCLLSGWQVDLNSKLKLTAYITISTDEYMKPKHAGTSSIIASHQIHFSEKTSRWRVYLKNNHSEPFRSSSEENYVCVLFSLYWCKMQSLHNKLKQIYNIYISIFPKFNVEE